MTYDILFAVVGIGLIAFGVNLIKLSKRIDLMRLDLLNHEKRFVDIDIHWTTDLLELDKAVERIQALEDRLEGQEALTANLEEKLNNSGGE